MGKWSSSTGPLTTYTVTDTIDGDATIGRDNIDRYTAKYVITQSDVDSGFISNVVSLTGGSLEEQMMVLINLMMVTILMEIPLMIQQKQHLLPLLQWRLPK